MGRPPKHYSDAELAALRDRRNELRREGYRLDGGKRKAENQRWKDAHREQVRAASRNYQNRRRQLDRDGESAKQKEWRKRNPDKVKRYRENWYSENGREYYRKWATAKRISDPELFIWRNARNRAKEKGLAFSITLEDIVIPEYCPVLGIKIEKQSGSFLPNSPSIDRFDPSKGYVPGNIFIISNRANIIKRDCTVEEVRSLLAWMERVK